MTDLTYASLSKALVALNSLVEQDKAKAYVFPSAARIRMGVNLERLRALVVKIETEQTDLFKTYGSEQTDKPGTFQVMKTSEKWSEFEKAYNDLHKAEFAIDLQPLAQAELINARVVKSRDEKGQISENPAENQIPMDLIADLLSAKLLTTT